MSNRKERHAPPTTTHHNPTIPASLPLSVPSHSNSLPPSPTTQTTCSRSHTISRSIKRNDHEVDVDDDEEEEEEVLG